MKRKSLPLLAIPLFAATAFYIPYPWSDARNARLGRPARVDGVIIQVSEVLEDSRCPVDVDCVWPGQVRVSAGYLHPRRGEEDLILIVGQPKKVPGGTVLIEAVRPGRRLGQKLQFDDYRFDLRFEAGD